MGQDSRLSISSLASLDKSKRFLGVFMIQIFQVSGMTCGHCEKAVTRALQQLDPQAVVQIDRARNHVEVQSQQAREALAQAIAQEGYSVTKGVAP
jgi:copper chaperone